MTACAGSVVANACRMASLAAVNARPSTLADILSVPRSSPCSDASAAPSTALEPCSEPSVEPSLQHRQAAATRERAEGPEVSTSCAVVTTHVESAAEERAGGPEGAREGAREGAGAQHTEGQAAAAETSRQDGGDQEDTPVVTKAKPRRPKRRDPCALEAGDQPPTDADELTWCPIHRKMVRMGKRNRAKDDKQLLLTRAKAAVEDICAVNAQRVVVFSGSGISKASGMSTFSDPGGLYERARKKYSLTDGMRLFHYSFFQKRREDAQCFLSGVWSEAVQATPTASHHAVAKLAENNRLLRHYTMNIDGLHNQQACGLRWDPELHPTGLTVEMHGNVNEAVCEECAAVYPMEGAAVRAFRAKRNANCTVMRSCKGLLRPRIMFYADENEDLITQSFDELLEEDLKTADLVLWVGISFHQSASVEHFRRVRRALQTVGRMDTLQVVVNPDEEAMWNLTTALSNVDDICIKQLCERSDDVLPLIAGEPPSVLEPRMAKAPKLR